jgi:hypothetical protein
MERFLNCSGFVWIIYPCSREVSTSRRSFQISKVVNINDMKGTEAVTIFFSRSDLFDMKKKRSSILCRQMTLDEDESITLGINVQKSQSRHIVIIIINSNSCYRICSPFKG